MSKPLFAKSISHGVTMTTAKFVPKGSRPTRWLLLGILLLNPACQIFDQNPSSLDSLDPNGSHRLGAIPPRPRQAASGSEFRSRLEKLAGDKREAAILGELRRGNMPSYLRQLQPIHSEQKIAGKTIKATYWVLPDYLAVGSDQDYLYIPMTPATAQRLGDHFGFVLPTRKMVDQIYLAATLKVTPKPLKASAAMSSTAYYAKHHSLLKEQIPKAKDELIAGHKKDIVLTNKLCQLRHRVAIYGWHQPSGRPIQPLSLVHGENYADYSHGVRLVYGMMLVDGVWRPVAEVMQDPVFATLISDEGVLRQTRFAIDCRSC